MDSEQKIDKKTRRDFVFFAGGVPDELFLLHSNYAFAKVGSDQIKLVNELSKHSDGVAIWLKQIRGKFCAVVFRNESISEKEGFLDAYERLSSILDGFALFTEDCVLSICPLVLIRNQEDPDAFIKFFASRAWISWGSPTEEAEKAWKERKDYLTQRFIAFFESVPEGNLESQPELIVQLGLSAKMYRHGEKSEAYGIEFLCKFTTLEGLVCGSQKHGHGSLLKSRLSSLFKNDPDIASKVQELWGLRCGGSHQGNAFSGAFSSKLQLVEQLILGTVIFALDNIKSVQTVDELWNKVYSYTLPPGVLTPRPKHRAAVIHMLGDFGKWHGAGTLTDEVFNQMSKFVKKA